VERHYEKHLYGDVSLFQLPDRPRLYILATNLSEGCLSSFYQGGLLLQRRIAGRRDRFERVPMGLATVPMAVAASSAFPGFFPPLELKAAEVGADVGAFSRQSFTDGGIYDNIGLRMFRHIEQSWIRDIAPLGHDDILELDAVIAALTTAENLPEGTPLRRLSELVARVDPSHTPTALIGALWEVIQNDRLYSDESFRSMELTDPGAQSLLQYLDTSNSDPDSSDRVWLNRQIVEATLQQVIGKPCLRS
jgi:predicted acylesterase/phospholipase RssA